MTDITDLCWQAAKLLPFDPHWPTLRQLAEEMATKGSVTAEELAKAYVEKQSTPQRKP